MLEASVTFLGLQAVETEPGFLLFICFLWVQPNSRGAGGENFPFPTAGRSLGSEDAAAVPARGAPPAGASPRGVWVTPWLWV